jgi:ribonucleotide reductase alpha subunit
MQLGVFTLYLVLSGLTLGRKRGLPISCNGIYIEDRMDSILEKQAEVGIQTKHGAGTSAYFGSLRGRGRRNIFWRHI